MYIITKVINNNIICSNDENGNEVILRGLGIGFKKKIDDIVESERIEKIYTISNKVTSNKLQELLANIPDEYINTCNDIIDYTKNSLGKQLNDNIYITLTDHINFAIERKKQNLEYKNALLLEIKRFYPKEYKLGIKALEIIKANLNINLSVDEAGFIALHIVNSELNTKMDDMFNITQLIQKVLEIIKSYYNIELDENSIHYERLITHLKFFGQRLFSNISTKDDDLTFHKMVKERFKNDYECAKQIRDYVKETYNKQISEEEMIFLTIHLRRVSII